MEASRRRKRGTERDARRIMIHRRCSTVIARSPARERERERERKREKRTRRETGERRKPRPKIERWMIAGDLARGPSHHDFSASAEEG